MTRPAYKAALLALSVVLLSHCAPAPRPPATEVGSRQIERTMMDDIVDRMQIREATERQRKADELVSRLEYYKAYKVYDEGGKPFENDRNLLYRKYKSLIDAQKMVDEHRQSALANYQLGKAYYDYTAEPDGASRRVALMERAREHLERAIRLDSNQEQAFLLLARVMEEQGKSEQFQPYLPKLEKIENKSDMTLLFLGAEYVRKGDHQRAEDYLNRIPDGSPQCIQAMYYQGLIDAEKGLWLEALVNFSRARNLNPEAERKFKEALDRVRGSSNTLRSQGMQAYGAGRFSEAARYLQAHVLYNPQDLEAQYLLARALLSSGQRSWAEEQFLVVTRVGSSLEGMNPLAIDSITRALNLQKELKSDPEPVRKTVLEYFTRQIAMIDSALERAMPSEKEIQVMAEDEVLFRSGWKRFDQRLQQLRKLEQSRTDTVNKANSLLRQNAIARKDWAARIQSMEDLFQKTLIKLRGRGGI